MSARNSLQRALMRHGDFHLPSDSRNRFGRLESLSTGAAASGNTQPRNRAPFVETPVYDEPRTWKLEMRIAGPSGVFSTMLPDLGGGNEYSLRVHVRRALDRDKGTVDDLYVLSPVGVGDLNALPVVCLIAQQLGVYVEIVKIGADVTLAVEVTASPVDAACCDDIATSPTITRVTQTDSTAVLLAANPLRKQFVIQNFAGPTKPLYVAYGNTVTPPGGSQPRWTFALPNQYDVFAGSGYTGPIVGVWDADGAQYAMVTEVE